MCLTLESSQNFAASPLSTTMAFGVTQVPSVHKVVVSKRPERKGGSRGLVSGKELFKNTSKFKFAASPRSPSLFLPPFRNDYRGEQASAGIAGIIRMAELGVLDAYLATLEVLSSRITRMILARSNHSLTSLLRIAKQRMKNFSCGAQHAPNRCSRCQLVCLK
jgi:hypothetical protein